MATTAAAAGPTGAERLLRAAVDAGIEVCFANPGTSEMHFVAAMDSTLGGTLRPILGLHETVCTGAAGDTGEVREVERAGWLAGRHLPLTRIGNPHIRSQRPI